jgi:hypothetical protein
MSEKILLEVCVDSPQSLAAAIEGGADRIELCAALETGGLTPSPGLMALATTAPIPVYAMIRTRPGDFVFDDADMATLLADIDAVRAAGLAGVVFGANRPDGCGSGPGCSENSRRGLGYCRMKDSSRCLPRRRAGCRASRHCRRNVGNQSRSSAVGWCRCAGCPASCKAERVGIDAGIARIVEMRAGRPRWSGCAAFPASCLR